MLLLINPDKCSQQRRPQTNWFEWTQHFALQKFLTPILSKAITNISMAKNLMFSISTLVYALNNSILQKLGLSRLAYWSRSQ